MEIDSAFWDYIAPIGSAYLIAWFVHRLTGRWTRRVVGLSDFAPQGMRVRQERKRTLNDLLSSAITFLAFLVATIFTLGLFVDTTSLVWTIGLFSAAFGLGARPIISDYLTGMTFLFGDVFDVGDKVEILGIEGVIERITLSMVTVRSTKGEVYVIPNGEVRIVRNFSRGKFSSANIVVKIVSADLSKALPILSDLANEAVDLFPPVREPLQIINDTGQIGKHVELTLVASVAFGAAAETRLQLLQIVIERLTEAGIELAS